MGKEKVSRRGHYCASGRRIVTRRALGSASRKPVVVEVRERPSKCGL